MSGVIRIHEIRVFGNHIEFLRYNRQEAGTDIMAPTSSSGYALLCTLNLSGFYKIPCLQYDMQLKKKLKNA